jgi:CopG family transcriptional regulator, nickel-responsive regulator
VKADIHPPSTDELSRIGVAGPTSLLDPFDQLIAGKGYANRSEAFRDLMREALIKQTVANPNTEVVGTVTLVYDHHIRQLNDRLIGMQHDHFSQIISSVHVHLDHDSCLEVVILRGKGLDVQRIPDSLIATKGVRHGQLIVTTSGAA